MASCFSYWKKSIFSDSISTISYKEAKKQKFDSVVIGGGNIIKNIKTTLNIYHDISVSAYASLWIGAAVLASKNKAPLIINGPSISGKIKSKYDKLYMRKILNKAAYISFRDPESVEIAKKICPESNPVFIPDTVFSLKDVWKKEILINNYKYTVVHLNQRYCPDISKMAEIIEKLYRVLKMKIIILPIGPCHGDIEYSNNVCKKVETPCEVFDDFKLSDFSKIISNSEMYIGSSMHGLITALNYKIPSLLVLNENPMRKFYGVLNVAGLGNDIFCQNWSDVISKINNNEIIRDVEYDKIDNQLKKHWERVSYSVENGKKFKLFKVLYLWKYWYKIFLLAKKIIKRLK